MVKHFPFWGTSEEAAKVLMEHPHWGYETGSHYFFWGECLALLLLPLIIVMIVMIVIIIAIK